MAVAFAILFPLGAIGVRLFRVHNLVRFHMAWQLLALALALAGMGMGVWLAVFTNQVRKFGTGIFCNGPLTLSMCFSLPVIMVSHQLSKVDMETFN